MALQSKKPRLSSFGRTSFVSESALSALIGEIREHGLLDASSRSSISRDKRKELNEKTQSGDILKTVDAIGHDDEPIPLTVLNPFAFLQLAINRSDKFRAFLLRIFQLYSDEITPGQVLVAHQQRKTQTVYWSVMEFGQPVLSCEYGWFPIATARKEEIDDISGGMGQLLKICMQHFVGDGSAAQHDLRNGFQVWP